MTFSGAYVAIVTPFDHGKIDEAALRRHIDFLIDGGIDGLVPCGTTGESVTLSDAEKCEVVRIAVHQAAGRVPVIAGAGSSNTAHAVQLARLMRETGADALLEVTPSYNKPTQEGLYRHFEAISQATPLPIILYNVPGRTAVDMLAETVIRLSLLPNIAGIKECAGVERVTAIRSKTKKSFLIFSGEDAQNAELYRAGAQGTISVAGNVTPALVSETWDKAAQGDWSGAESTQDKLQLLNKTLFIETNPIPVKTALAIMGRMREEFRLPLCEMQPANRALLEQCLKQYKLC